jgi:23S rRNA U2552 (ribose-2'-O)-methylase RlmE/FtsJ
MITETRLEKALRFLAETDSEYAALKSDMLRSEYLAKTAEALAFKHLKAEGGGVEECKQSARLSEAVQAAWEKHFSAVQAFEEIRARRERETIVIDVWRSLESSRRAGLVT